MKEQNR